MNAREKNLLFILIAAAFVIVNIFLFTTYQSGMQRMKIELAGVEKSYQQKYDELVRADERVDEMNWLANNQPAEGTHGRVGAALAVYANQSAKRYGIEIKTDPYPLPEDPNELGAYRSATVKAVVNGRDPEIYRWLIDLQDPAKSRSITLLRIVPQRGPDNTRIDVEIEVTEWFSPIREGESPDPSSASIR